MKQNEIEIKSAAAAVAAAGATSFVQSNGTEMGERVRFILDAHGGLDLWRSFNGVSGRIVTGGMLWAIKGFDIGDEPRTMTSAFRRQRTTVEPFGQADWRMIYNPDRVVIETREGQIIAEQQNPRDTFAGHAWETPWTPAQLGYFNGYAMWTYYNLPFLIGEPGMELTRISSIDEGGLRLSGLKVRFPKNIHTHSAEQDLYFDESGLLRRQDYRVDVAGGKRAAHLITDYIDVQGLKFAAARRVYGVGEDGSLQLDKTLVSIDLSDFRLS